jgi:hypothetical protein
MVRTDPMSRLIGPLEKGENYFETISSYKVFSCTLVNQGVERGHRRRRRRCVCKVASRRESYFGWVIKRIGKKRPLKQDGSEKLCFLYPNLYRIMDKVRIGNHLLYL